MKNKKLCGIVIVAAMIANVTFFALASATTTTSDVVISAGGLTIDSVPASANFAGASVSTSDQDLTDVTFPNGDPVQFSDLRSTNVGYTLFVTTENFLDLTTMNAIPYDGFEMAGSTIGGLAAIGSSDCVTGVTVTSAVNPFTGTGTISDPKDLVTADTSIVRVDTCIFTPTIDLV
ncbi:MAG: hypothetical protein ACD_65C00010G0002, partial [uncultured bacterium]